MNALEVLKKHLKVDWMFGGDSGKAILAAMEEYASQSAGQGSEGDSEAIKQFDRAIRALSLELHSPVWDDVNIRWNILKASIQPLPVSPSKPTSDGADIDGMLDWAENEGWVWNKSMWRKDGYRSRTSHDLFNSEQPYNKGEKPFDI